jgi:hypothetical protein
MLAGMDFVIYPSIKPLRGDTIPHKFFSLIRFENQIRRLRGTTLKVTKTFRVLGSRRRL